MKLELNIPTGWAQLTDKQLLIISKLMLDQNTAVEMQTKALTAFCSLRIIEVTGDDVLVQIKRKLYELKTWQINAAKSKLNWTTETLFDIRPLSKLCHRKPVDKWMQATRFVQYLAAENYYQAYLHTKEPVHLFKLAAVLYPPKGEFNDSKIAAYSKRFIKATPEQINTVFMWYTSIKQIFAKQFPHLFVTVKNMEDELDENTMPNMRKMIDNMLYSLNNGDITKDALIFKTDTWRALAMLDKKAHEYQELINAQQKK